MWIDAYANGWRAGANSVSSAAATSGIKQNVKGLMDKIANIGRQNARGKDWRGAAKERMGGKSGGDHTQEMKQSIGALNDATEKLSENIAKHGNSMTSAQQTAVKKAINFGNNLKKAMSRIVD